MGAAAIPLIVAGGAYSAYQQGQAGKAQASYYSYLGKTAQANAGIAIAKGEATRRAIGAQEFDEQQRLSRGIRQTVANQKAAMVNGVGATSRSAQDIVSDTLTKGNLDEMALRYNADLRARNAMIGADAEAFNYESQAGGYSVAGKNAIAGAKAGQISTLLGTAGSVASNWYDAKEKYSKNTIGQVE